MESILSYEEVTTWARILAENGFEIFHGDYGSRTVESDGFFWWSVYLVKNGREMTNEEIEKNAILCHTHEVHEEDEEDDYYENLQNEFDDSIFAIEEFLSEIWYDDDYEMLKNYISKIEK